ncbi:hypothetical protein IT41_14115 [Paracoccus halophilus]|uniref:Uncharacterized protein n=1 Tax=Paracoccus halophilus TaxID=376733 RepID=A0A099EZM5_9RHOB|nr:hypothetical protein IT41_14115 [Paracoccus halophilus]
MRLMTGMFTGDTVEPALDTACQPEIVRVDGEDQRTVKNTVIEPFGQDKLHAFYATIVRGHLFPFVDPGELTASPMLAVTDRRGDDGGLQPGKCCLQQQILPVSAVAADGAQQMIGREAKEAGCLDAIIFGSDDLTRSPDQHIGVPDRRHTVFRHSEYLHLDIGCLVEDRFRARRLRQREEWPLHQIALIAWTGITGCDHEGIEVTTLAVPLSPSSVMVIDAPHSELAPLFRRQGARRKDRASVLVTGRLSRADVGPGLEIIDGIEDAATDFAIGRAGPVGPVFFQCAKRNAKETRSFLGAQHAWWHFHVTALCHEITSSSSG